MTEGSGILEGVYFNIIQIAPFLCRIPFRFSIGLPNATTLRSKSA